MEFQVEGKQLQIKPNADLVASRIESLRNQIMDELKKNSSIEKVIFNVEGVDIVDSLGVNLIIGLYRQLTAESKSFEIVEAGEKFMKVSNFFRFSSLFGIKSKEEDHAG